MDNERLDRMFRERRQRQADAIAAAEAEQARQLAERGAFINAITNVIAPLFDEVTNRCIEEGYSDSSWQKSDAGQGSVVMTIGPGPGVGVLLRLSFILSEGQVQFERTARGGTTFHPLGQPTALTEDAVSTQVLDALEDALR